jgi:hypothetical protein
MLHGANSALTSRNRVSRSSLRSFYKADPLVAQPASIALEEARELLKGGHTAAAQVFAAIAVEVCLKSALLRPIVHGLVHSDWAADLVLELALPDGPGGATPADKRFKGLLFKVLAEHGGINLCERHRPGSQANLWCETKQVRQLRNRIVHSGKAASRQKAEQAIGVAEAVLEELFQSVILSLGFHLHDGARICWDAWRCKNRARKGLWEDKREPPPAWGIPPRA